MIRLRISVALALCCASGTLFADGSGTLYSEGKKITLSGAYALRLPDRFNEGSEITRVVFADRAIDAKALANAVDREGTLKHMLKGANSVALNIESDGTVQNVNAQVGDTGSSASGSGWYTLDLKRNDATHIEGSFRSSDESNKTSGQYFDLIFAFDLPGPADLGPALPAGGGAAGEAYLTYLKAVGKGDVDVLATTMTQARAEEFLADRNKPYFMKMFGFLQEQAMRDAKYVKGNSTGDTAVLEYSGKNKEGNAKASTVILEREGDQWKVAKESSKIEMK